MLSTCHTSANPGGGAGRGVPDVAGDADPTTGYQIRVDGQDTVIGGTSAVAPLWAGLVAVANQQLGPVLSVLVVFLASLNVFGGYVVTQRMLAMFKPRATPAPGDGSKR